MNLLYYVSAVLSYAVVGGIWSFFRWSNFVVEELDFYESERRRFLRFHRIVGEDIPDFLQYEWKHIVEASERLRAVPPIIQQYRGHVAFDTCMWPLSVLIVSIRNLYVMGMNLVIVRYKNITQTKIEMVRKDLKKK